MAYSQTEAKSASRANHLNTGGFRLNMTPAKVCFRPRLCKNVFQRDRYSKPDWKSRFYAKSTSADGLINFRFNVDAHTSIWAKRFYTLWVTSGHSQAANIGQEQSFVDGRFRPMAVNHDVATVIDICFIA
jgi:hypothetical protein